MKTMNGICIFAAVLALASLAYVSEALGAVVPAATCSQEDVQAAVDAAADGDIVTVPAGECTWTTLETMTPSVWITGKSVALMGSGMDATIITDETGDAYNEEPVVSESDGVRITGLRFKGMKRRSSTEPAIVIGGALWRIDHCAFDSSETTPGEQGRGIVVGGTGVVDHNIFLNSYTAVSVMGDGDASWERPLDLGSAEAVYIEDNVMDNTDIVGDGATDAYGGARYVFRYNAVTNARAGHHGFDTGGYRSPHSFEVYDNTFTWTVDNSWYTARYRGGTGVVFDNVIEGTASETLTFGVVNYRTCCCTPDELAAGGCDCPIPPCHDSCGTWGRCDGDNPLDGNLDAMGYPCHDQVGRSTDADGDTIQDLEPLYGWGNTVNGLTAAITMNDPWGCSDPSMADHLQEGRDFINAAPRPGYTPYTYPHPLTQAAEDCAALGGTCCTFGQVCDGGVFQDSTDCASLCCTGGTCAEAEAPAEPAPDGAGETMDAAHDDVVDLLDVQGEEEAGEGASGCGCAIMK
jgi:hypothetical protein